ncbi:phosphoserine phosphatase [Azospirillum fermentarium]|uniref:phosphoserine phosphatase SerB n=1 Tax=Azospirillum fermentarium TaxID=1233114 RepID=UPI002225FFCB|nr:phosphoserine phosphatase SerB [Azospirillum fermentarium]MCW2245033.1 phosphoserine phosphatase [Azospirillum fermentarium]
MNAVLTLIANPAAPCLTDTMAEGARAALKALGGDVAPPGWLAPGVAVDIAFDGLAPEQAEAAVRPIVEGQPVDVVAQPMAGRRKRLLVADMESTIIEQEMLDELGDYVGKKEHIAAITARAMNGEIDFKGALRERVALLKGLSAATLDEVWGRATLMPGAKALVATMRASGAYCVLVSGGFTCFTGRVRDWVGFHEDHGNGLEIDGGVLTGRPTEPILDRDSKLEALLRYAGAQRVPVPETMTVGDGANDLPMLLAAGVGVAFHAKPSVAAQARARIDHGDLTALLYIQGYRAADIVADTGGVAEHTPG